MLTYDNRFAVSLKLHSGHVIRLESNTRRGDIHEIADCVDETRNVQTISNQFVEKINNKEYRRRFRIMARQIHVEIFALFHSE